MNQVDFQHKWSLYFSLESGEPEYELVKSVFRKLLTKLGGGSLKETAPIDFDGNPRDGFRRPIHLEGFVEGKWFFCVWAGTEWKNTAEKEVRFELPIAIKSNLPWSQDEEIWSWLSKQLINLGYKDEIYRTFSVTDLVKRLEKENLPEEAKFHSQRQQK